MAQLKKYRAKINGLETVLMLTEEEAKRRKLTEVKQAAPANKGRTPANKSSTAGKAPGDKSTGDKSTGDGDKSTS